MNADRINTYRSDPLAFIADAHQRIEMYRKLAEATDLAAIEKLRSELKDRFGTLPRPVELLLQVAGLLGLSDVDQCCVTTCIGNVARDIDLVHGPLLPQRTIYFPSGQLLYGGDGVFGCLRHSELHCSLSFDLDRFAGLWIASDACSTLRLDQFAEARDGELAIFLGFLNRSRSQEIEEGY